MTRLDAHGRDGRPAPSVADRARLIGGWLQSSATSVADGWTARRAGRRPTAGRRPSPIGGVRSAHPRTAAVALISAILLGSWAIVGAMSVPSAASTAVDFITFGDAGTGSAGQLALRDRMAAQSNAYQFALLTGDGAYPSGSFVDYNAKWSPVYAGLYQGSGVVPPSPTTLTPKPIWTAPGNHDYDTANAAGYKTVFVMPTNGPAGVPAESFYTFDVGGVHFVSFDSERLVGWRFDPSQAEVDAVRNWLITDLDANRDKVTVVFDHHPAYTAGPHRGETEETEMRTTWFPLFANHGVDLMLSGHDHSYQRNTPQAGLTSYVTGGGGGALTAVTPQSYTAASVSDFHFIKVSVDGCTISTVAIRSNGADFDPWSYQAPTCTAPGSSSSPAPSGQLFADGFETGTFGAWTSVQAGVGAVAEVQGANVKTGSSAARFQAVAQTGSYAYARRSLGSGFSEVRVGLDVSITGEGASGGNVPILRLYNTSGARVLSLYRQNLASSKLYVQHSGAYNTTTGILPLNTWRRFEVRVVVDGGASTVEIRADGVMIHQTLLANLGTLGVQTIQIGNDTSGQAFSAVVDNVMVTDGAPLTTPTASPTAPTGSPSATPTSSPSPTPTATATATSTASASATASPTATPSPTPTGPLVLDGFEAGNLDTWTVRNAAGGVVGVTTNPVVTGTYAARLSATSAGGSYAYARKSFAPRPSIRVRMQVRVAVEGASGGNVPLVRILDASGGRVVSVFRQNLSSDRLYVTYGGVNYLTTGRLPLATWALLDVRVIVAGAGSTVTVTLDGTQIYSSSSATLSTQPAMVQIGNETKKQPFQVVIDDVRVDP